MTKNILISQHIWLGVLFVLSSLLHVSCEGCSPVELERDKDSEIAKITMDSQEITGYINYCEPVVKIQGNITEKHIPDTSKLCLLVIPKGKVVKEAIEKFQENKQELGYGNKEVPRIPLNKNDLSQGAVCYIKEVSGPEQGRVGASVFVDQLPTGSYETYLLLHTKGYGTVFSNAKPLEIPVYSNTTDPTIKMVDAKPERDTAQNTKISAQADIENVNVTDFAGMKGWFLFIKKGVTTDAKTVVADLLKSEKEFPPDLKFTSVADGKAIVYPFKSPVGKDNKIEGIDDDPHKKLFEKGVTYTVCACFLGPNKTDANPSYGISDNKEITIPKPEVELEVKECIIEGLFKCLDADEPTDLLSIAYTTKIVKQLGTFKPKVGLLFVKGAKVADSKMVEEVLKKAPIDKYYKDGEDIAYLIGSIAENHTGEVQDKTDATSRIHLELGATYNVSFFLQDGGGEIFLSKNKVALRVPKADVKIDSFSVDLEIQELIVKEVLQVTSEIFPDNHDPLQVSTGYVLATPGNKISAGILQRVVGLTHMKPEIVKQKAPNNTIPETIQDGDMLFITARAISQSSSLVGAFTGAYGPQVDDSPGATKDVYGVWACENAIFYKKGNNQFKFYNPLKNTGAKIGPIDYLAERYEIEHGPNFSNAKIFKQTDNHGSKAYIPYVNTDEAFYTEILKLGIKGDNAAQNIKKFIDNMHP